MELEHTIKTIEVYICPTPGCPGYHGQNGMPDLVKEFTGVKADDAGAVEAKGASRYQHSRAECPLCRVAGRGRIVRIRMKLQVKVPVVGPPPPELPKPNPTTKLAGASRDGGG